MGDHDVVSAPLEPRVLEYLTPCSGDFFKTFQYSVVMNVAELFSLVVEEKPTSSFDESDVRIVKNFSKLLKDGGKNNKRCFEREVGILSKLNHKNIVKMITACECPSMYYISTPYYSNGILHDILPNMNQAQINRIFLQLTSAVQHIHSMQVAHRDINPDTVYISSGGDAVLTDFGNACSVTSRKTPLKHRTGTPGYIAPEIIFSSKNTEIDYYKCDMFSLGMVLWCMVVGDTPKPNTTLPDMMRRVPRDAKPRGSYYHIILRLLSKPEQRWDSQFLVALLKETWPSSFGIDVIGYLGDSSDVDSSRSLLQRSRN